MKANARGWVILCVLALIFAGCQSQKKETEKPVVEQKEKTAETIEQLPPDILGIGPQAVHLGQGLPPTWSALISLQEQIRKDIGALEGYFKGGAVKQIEKIVELLSARSAVVSGFNYQLMYGNNSLGFWTKIHTEGATLKLKVVSIYVSLAPGPFPKLPVIPEELAKKMKPGYDLRDAIAFVAVEIHVITGAEAALHNDTYFMDLAYPHHWCCVWGEEQECPPTGAGAPGQ